MLVKPHFFEKKWVKKLQLLAAAHASKQLNFLAMTRRLSFVIARMLLLWRYANISQQNNVAISTWITAEI